MIIGERKPLAELVAMARPHRRIVLAGCATCVAECAAGGEREVAVLAPALHLALAKEGIDVTVVPTTLERQCEWEFLEALAPLLEGADALMSMACGIGVQAVAERYPELKVYPAVNTTFLGLREELGVWAVRCAACGDCVLDRTGGICPVARCSKSLMNGPCGGTTKEGRCEVSPEIECAWAKIVEKAEALGELERLTEIVKPKDWRPGGHGGPRRIVREDLKP